MGKIRGNHSSAGIYDEFVTLSYSTAKDMGLTSLGLVGETEKGPAFEVVPVENWEEFENYFGGKNPEKFKDSQYPKYELPYIAESYLKASKKLNVCRVLGLSGYNAGPAFIIFAKDDKGRQRVIAILRSRGKYNKYGKTACDKPTEYDKLTFNGKSIKLSSYTNLSVKLGICDEPLSAHTDPEKGIKIDALNRGRFTIETYSTDTPEGTPNNCYAVSLDPGAKDYIYNVLGNNPTEGLADVFVEELYDFELDKVITEGFSELSATTEPEVKISPIVNPVRDFVKIPTEELTRKQMGQTFIYSGEIYEEEKGEESSAITKYILSGNTYVEDGVDEGDVLIVKKIQFNEKEFYAYVFVDNLKSEEDGGLTPVVEVLSIDGFVKNTDSGLTNVSLINDYREQFRWATTPWVVSELKGDGKNIEVKKLFRFHTITDGDFANHQIKISIANVRPDAGTFDVYVRDFEDSDANPTILESYKGVSMVPGDPKYIGLKIGTIDGSYELKSKYVMLEIIENEMTKQCVPCGFLGYPTRSYREGLEAPTFTYNKIYDEDVKDRRQYFGLSDITGVDVDMLTYKGKDAYTENYEFGYTNAFHLDSTLDADILAQIGTEGSGITVTVDGVTGITWETVSANCAPEGGSRPIIGSESDMADTIYANVNLRKFTVYPYGGFDGWDIYRRSRTNTDEYRANKYKGTIKNGYGETFSKIKNGEMLSLSGNCITSDYYAYLAGINQFENPEKIEINVFATPGIDYVNNQLLVDDTIEMIERRRDSVYIPTTPDKPWGADDSESAMYSSSDVAANLEDSRIDTYFAASYYPWVKYFDKANSRYINLPVTKDVVRILANVDNKYFPWVAPAGFERAAVECEKMHFFPKLEDRDNVYDGRLNPLMSFTGEGVRIWGNKTLYISEETDPMNRLNTVRLMLYMRKLVIKACRGLIFNDTMKEDFESVVRPILTQIKTDRGITDYRLDISQTKEQMDLHEMSGKLFVKPTPVLEYIELSFVITPQGIEFDEI